MKTVIKISNKGVIDIGAFILLGASTKRNDPTKIGEYGSGLNYAIAYLLRHNINFSVYAGTEKVIFGTVDKRMRDSVFKVITINGQETSFTTEMGHDWNPWFVLREIWCNALDEGEADMKGFFADKEIETRPDGTTFYIEGTPEFIDVVDRWDMYFAHKRTPIATANGISVYHGGSDLVVYRKGIMIHHEKNVKCTFHYNFDNIKINEARVLDSHWEMRYKLSGWFANDAPEVVLREYIRSLNENKDNPIFENNIDFDYEHAFSKHWEAAIGPRAVVEKEVAQHYATSPGIDKAVELPSTIVKRLLKKADSTVEHIAGKNGKIGATTDSLDDSQRAILFRAMETLQDMEIEITWPTQKVKFQDHRRAIAFNDGVILLGDSAFQDVDTMCKLLLFEKHVIEQGLEKYSHHSHDYLLNEWWTALKNN